MPHVESPALDTENTIVFQPADLAEIVNSVFETMMNTSVTECDAPWFESGDRMSSSVQLIGAWCGAVMLECSREVACRFAAQFLSIDTPAELNDDVIDVFGELANMVGGNLKCILSPGIHLSMPSVVSGRDYAHRICGVEVKERLAFRFEDTHFWVSVLSVDPKQ